MALYAFDGTWNDSSAPAAQRDTRKDTNVHRFRVLYQGTTEYKDGVGTRYGMIGKLIGGLTGAGAERRIDEQFEALGRNFASGDTTIDVVGYSRGAAISRMFVHRIARDFQDLRRKNGRPLDSPPPVRFLGLFDTVASFGVPWNDDEDDFERDIPEFVAHAFHAMALDETRETFGIERCLGNRDKITEVWFRGGHGDIGGNATYVDRAGEWSNRERSDIALNWMLAKAKACGLPVSDRIENGQADGDAADPPVTALDEAISIGSAGTLSRRIHLGDLMHHTVEKTELTRGIDGRLLRRIDVLTRIENEDIEQRAEAMDWIPPVSLSHGPDNVKMSETAPSLVHLSLRRYPFDVLPARTWSAWIKLWEIENPGIEKDRMDEFWAPTDADRALAWDVYVELQTRIAVQALGEEEGDDATALTSIYTLFPFSREAMQRHGVDCANTGALLTAFLNQKVRGFTAKWHKRSVEEQWGQNAVAKHPDFRTALKGLQPALKQLAVALSRLADAQL